MTTYQIVAVVGAGMTLLAVPALFVNSRVIRWLPVFVLVVGFLLAWAGLILDLSHHGRAT